MINFNTVTQNNIKGVIKTESVFIYILSNF